MSRLTIGIAPLTPEDRELFLSRAPCGSELECPTLWTMTLDDIADARVMLDLEYARHDCELAAELEAKY